MDVRPREAVIMAADYDAMVKVVQRSAWTHHYPSGFR